MKLLAIVASLIVLAGCSSNKTTRLPGSKDDTIVPAPPVAKLDTVKKTAAIDTAALAKTPACITALISKFSSAAVENPPRKIVAYKYKGKVVFYVPSVCCDNFSDLYDDKCELIGHPDGGFTGKGDGNFPNFLKEATDEKLIWQDKRK